jgi:hypothetical protein
VSLGPAVAALMGELAETQMRLLVRPPALAEGAGPLLVERPVLGGVEIRPLSACDWPSGWRPAAEAAVEALHRHGLAEGLCLLAGTRHWPGQWQEHQPVLPAGKQWVQQSGAGGISLYPGLLGDGVLHASQLLDPADPRLAMWAAERTALTVQHVGDTYCYSTAFTAAARRTAAAPVTPGAAAGAGLSRGAAGQAGAAADAAWTALLLGGDLTARAGFLHLPGLLAPGEVGRLDVPAPPQWALRPSLDEPDPRGHVATGLEVRGEGWPGLASLLLAGLTGGPVVVERVVTPTLRPPRCRYGWWGVHVQVTGQSVWSIGVNSDVLTRPGDVLVTGPDTAYTAQALTRPAVHIGLAFLFEEPGSAAAVSHTPSELSLGRTVQFHDSAATVRPRHR